MLPGPGLSGERHRAQAQTAGRHGLDHAMGTSHVGSLAMLLAMQRADRSRRDPLLHDPTQLARFGDCRLKGVRSELAVSGDMTVGFSQLRVRIRFGLSGALR